MATLLILGFLVLIAFGMPIALSLTTICAVTIMVDPDLPMNLMAAKLFTGTDVFINPASQEIYAEFYNGVLGTDLTWEEIFAQTDRDINLQRVLNVLRYREETASHDWIPDRAIGPTDDTLYTAEEEFNDSDLAARFDRSIEDLAGMPVRRKREMLMGHRKSQLRKLIDIYYRERGWNSFGIPMPETLRSLGLWEFLDEEARSVILELTDEKQELNADAQNSEMFAEAVE